MLYKQTEIKDAAELCTYVAWSTIDKLCYH